MTARAAAGLLVSALIRAVEAAGGGGMVLAKGDATSGAILLVLAERGRVTAVRERAPALEGGYVWIPAGPAAFADPVALADYIARRRSRDPDLWVVELDHADALTLADGMIR